MNIPNILTVLRFLLIPAFVYYFFSAFENGIRIATGIFILAGLTDILDGYIARKYNLVTRLGIIMDPLADKLMLLTVLVSITVKHQIPLWIIFVVAAKEILMVLGAITLFNDHDIVVPANRFGKLSTIAFYIAVLTMTFRLPYSSFFMYVFVLATFLALIAYLNNYLSIKKKHRVVNPVKK